MREYEFIVRIRTNDHRHSAGEHLEAVVRRALTREVDPGHVGVAPLQNPSPGHPDAIHRQHHA